MGERTASLGRGGLQLTLFRAAEDRRDLAHVDVSVLIDGLDVVVQRLVQEHVCVDVLDESVTTLGGREGALSPPSMLSCIRPPPSRLGLLLELPYRALFINRYDAWVGVGAPQCLLVLHHNEIVIRRRQEVVIENIISRLAVIYDNRSPNHRTLLVLALHVTGCLIWTGQLLGCARIHRITAQHGNIVQHD